jgi:hypothetical protein
MSKIEQNERVMFSNTVFWLCAAMIIMFMTFNCARDVARPFSGLHSWAQASGAWAARSHAKYGFGYTHGLSTWAVGNPPKANPDRYLDHPQLGGISNGIIAKIFGAKEYTFRVVNLITNVFIMLTFVLILKKLTDPLVALLSALIYAMFPITAYFCLGWWTYVFSFGAIYFYLVLIKALKDNPNPNVWHKIGLAAGLFLSLQITWTGFFYAFGVGLHYLCRCLKRKQRPDKSLLAILVIAPLASMAITFTIMTIGYGGIGGIIELYKWRAGNAEVAAATAAFDWDMWFNTLWKYSSTNYTTPIVLAAIVYMTFGQFLVFTGPKDEETGRFKYQFPQFWLFAVPALTQLFALRGCLWKHQTWLHPFDPVVAIAAALFVMLIYDLVKKINIRLAVSAAAVVLGIFAGYCIAGTNYYYDIRWQPEEKVEMFKMLNQRIPADKYLLSFEPLTVDQNKSKGAFYRPEVAWYLDREITPAQTFEEVEKYAATGNYPYYLIPNIPQLRPLINQLMQKYDYEYIPPVQGKQTASGEFLRAGMYPYFIFDLSGKKGK